MIEDYLNSNSHFNQKWLSLFIFGLQRLIMIPSLSVYDFYYLCEKYECCESDYTIVSPSEAKIIE